MFNKEHSEEGLGPFPKGRYGVLTIVKKKFGEEAVADAEKCVDYLENEYHTQTEGSIQGGVWTADPPQPGQPNVPAPSGDPESAPTKTPGKVTTIEPGSAIRVAPTPTPPTKKVKEAEEFDIILKLAGLAK
jgi:hypothetical protein